MKWVWSLLIWLVVFGARFGSSFQGETSLRELEGVDIKLVGRISSESLLQGNTQKFKVGRIEVRTKQYPKYHYGDMVQVSGTLQRRVINKWYSQFSLMYPSVKPILEKRQKIIGLDIKKNIYKLREGLERVINRSLSEPEASLLAGILLGVKRDLPREFWQALQKTSTLHIVVASGYNVTVVIGTVIFLLAGLFNRRVAIFWGVAAVVVYTMMAGAEPAIIRAAIMGSLAYFGQVIGREGDGLRALGLAVGVMLLAMPMLVFDIGFQLSVMATLGLILIGPMLKPRLGRIWGVGGDMAETVSAQLAVWPILVINFGNMSLFGILVNSLILWLVPIVMGLGGVMGLVGLIWEPLARVAGWLVYVPLTVMVRVIEWFGEQEWISYQVKGINWWWGIGYYVVLLIIIGYSRSRTLQKTDVEVD